MSQNIIYKKLIEHFKRRSTMSRSELEAFFHSFEPDLKENTFNWRVFDLKKKHIINEVKTGLFIRCEEKRHFTPELSEKLRHVSQWAISNYDLNFTSIWETDWLNEFMELQATTSMIIIEIEKGMMESLFYSLKDAEIPEVFINPNEPVISRYISEAKQPVIIKPFISRSPAQLENGIKIHSLEKILVDLICDDHIYYSFQGERLKQIYQTATGKYHLNYSKILTYAKRRSREEDVKGMLEQTLDNNLKQYLK